MEITDFKSAAALLVRYYTTQKLSQLSRKITGIKKICKTWDLYQSILYILEDYFLKKTKFFNPGFFFYRPISGFTL